MQTYIYKVTPESSKRGYNRTIEVYRVKNNKPFFVGVDDEINTAAYCGNRAIACQIISDKTGAKMADEYKLQSKNIQLFEV